MSASTLLTCLALVSPTPGLFDSAIPTDHRRLKRYFHFSLVTGTLYAGFAATSSSSSGESAGRLPDVILLPGSASMPGKAFPPGLDIVSAHQISGVGRRHPSPTTPARRATRRARPRSADKKNYWQSENAAILIKAIKKVHEGPLWLDRSTMGRLFVELAKQKSRRAAGPGTRHHDAHFVRTGRGAHARKGPVPGQLKTLANKLSLLPSRDG